MTDWQPPDLNRVIRGVVLGTPLTVLLLLLTEGGLARSFLLVPSFGSVISGRAQPTGEAGAIRRP